MSTIVLCFDFGEKKTHRRPSIDSASIRPIFRPTPQNLTVGIGDRVVLKCRVDHLGTKTVSGPYLFCTPMHYMDYMYTGYIIIQETVLHSLVRYIYDF